MTAGLVPNAMRLVVAACAAVAVAVSGSGCGVQDGLPPLPPGADEPFDLFLRDEFDRVERAESTLFLDCLADAGYPEERALGVTTYPVLTALDEKPLRPRTEAEARTHGFGRPIPARPPEIVRTDAAFADAARACLRQARATLGAGKDVDAVRQQYVELGNRLIRERSERVEAILDQHKSDLVRCLAAHGHRVRPGATFDVEGDIEQFGVPAGSHVEAPATADRRPPGLDADATFRPGSPVRRYVPTEEETELALAFVRCGTSTGLFRMVENPSIQQQIVERHAAEFARLNPRLRALADRATKVLARTS